MKYGWITVKKWTLKIIVASYFLLLNVDSDYKDYGLGFLEKDCCRDLIIEIYIFCL